jgi:hypothetical protein
VWWDARWGYRVGVEVDAAGESRTDALVSVPVDFSAAFADLGVKHSLDQASIRVIERGQAGGIVDVAVPFQFDTGEGFNPKTSAAGNLWIELTGLTGPAETRRYDVYFDVLGSELPSVLFAPRVTVSEGVLRNGLTTLEVDTAIGTYYYDVDGGGFSSIIDNDGNDWISWNSAAGSAGAFRGIPNLVYPGGDFHPGNGGSTTTLISSGPLVATFRSTTVDGAWTAEWSVAPEFARMTLLEADSDYWFLYEGTPGGVLEPGIDIVTRSNGTTTSAATSWSMDLSGDEWVAFGDPGVGRSLYVANHQDDTARDSYRAMNGEMTVFGFGRDNLTSRLDHVPGRYTVGLVDAIAYSAVSPAIAEVTAPVIVRTTAPEGQLGIDASATASFQIANDIGVTAVFAET